MKTKRENELYDENIELKGKINELIIKLFKLENPPKYKEGGIVAHFKIERCYADSRYYSYSTLPINKKDCHIEYYGRDMLSGEEKALTEKDLDARKERFEYLVKNNMQHLIK